jgi:hypothetical protein
MRGIHYLVDENGTRTAAVVDLKRHRRLWEDLYDSMLAEGRRGEVRESLAQVKRRLQRLGKLKPNG